MSPGSFEVKPMTWQGSDGNAVQVSAHARWTTDSRCGTGWKVFRLRAAGMGHGDKVVAGTQPGEVDQHTLEEIEQGTRIRVLDGNGINLELDSKVEDSCDAIYRVLTDPKAERVFRSIQACTLRKVLEDDNNGKRKLLVSHRAITKFLWLSVTFETHLHVWENDRERTIRFMNARDGFMKRFEGLWHIRPYTQQSVNLVCQPIRPTASMSLHWPLQPPTWLNPSAMMSAAQGLLPKPPGHGMSLVSLEQHLLPSVVPPAPVRSLIRRMVAKQLRDMMEDLKLELQRRKSESSSTLSADSHAVAAGAATNKQVLPAGTASITASGLPVNIWDFTEPLVNITIQL